MATKGPETDQTVCIYVAHLLEGSRDPEWDRRYVNQVNFTCR